MLFLCVGRNSRTKDLRVRMKIGKSDLNVQYHGRKDRRCVNEHNWASGITNLSYHVKYIAMVA